MQKAYRYGKNDEVRRLSLRFTQWAKDRTMAGTKA